MSFPDATGPQHVGPDSLNLGPGTPILRRSVEAKPVTDLCTIAGDRARVLSWLAEGARDLSWALCSLPRERWAAAPPARLGTWPALRHARYLALRESYVTLPAVLQALGAAEPEPPSTSAELDEIEATWDADAAIASAEEIVHGLGRTRFDLLQHLEAASDTVWERPLLSPLASAVAGAHGQPVQLGWLMLHARYAEMEHLAAIWKVALYWDRFASSGVSAGVGDDPSSGLPLHLADRPEESH